MERPAGQDRAPAPFSLTHPTIQPLAPVRAPMSRSWIGRANEANSRTGTIPARPTPAKRSAGTSPDMD